MTAILSRLFDTTMRFIQACPRSFPRRLPRNLEDLLEQEEHLSAQSAENLVGLQHLLMLTMISVKPNTYTRIPVVTFDKRCRDYW